MDVVLNFYDDWIEMLRGELRQRGHTPPHDSANVAIRYFDLRRREISPQPRVVSRARSLTCPKRYHAGLEEIASKAAAGEDLTSHLSAKIHDLDYNDALLNDWGLYHLHLGTAVKANGFVTRTKSVLFARVTEDKFRMVAILDHGKGESPPWARKVLLETILENWPEELQPIQGVVGLADHPAEPEHLKLRERVTLLVQLSDGKVYFPLGGGASSAGSSTEAVRAHDHWAARLRTLENFVRENVEHLRSRLRDGQSFGIPPQFRLAFHPDGRPCAVEVTAKVAFILADG